jgi:fatty acid desaturase
MAIAVLVLFLFQFLRLAVGGGSKKELYLTLALFSITLGVWLIYNASFTWGWDVYTYVPLAFAVATFLLSVFGLFRLREEEGLGGFQKEI